MGQPRFAIRTVYGGCVRISGHDYRPNGHDPYHGELDGQRLVFGLYYTGDEMEPYISLWGTEEMYRCSEDEIPDNLWRCQPNLIDGRFFWEWWDRV